MKNRLLPLIVRYRRVVTFLVSFIVGLIAYTLIALYMAPSGAAVTRPYTNPAQFTRIPFGSHSHWLQPWRAYIETVPATTFLNGTSINWNVSNSANPDIVAAMLAKHGIRRARLEIGWGDIDFDDETKLIPENAARLRAILIAFKKYGIRPLILLNANQGMPCPTEVFERTVEEDANVGDTQLALDDVDGLVIDHSGLSNVTQYWAAEILINDINGNTITLSKPLPKPINAGTNVLMATIKYRPFEPPENNEDDDGDYQITAQGWQSYVGTVAKFVSGILGTTQSSDKGFDMEIWNELTFGSNFLFANKYYSERRYDYNDESIFSNLVKETVDYVNAHSADFQGVRLGDGFANTIPWVASSQEPARIRAIDKHPYANRKNYPADERDSTLINALGQEDTSGFVPKYSALFPEYYATALQTETMVRDMGPITTDINDINHGRNARVINGVVVPTPVWITEVNINPLQEDPGITAQRALAIKAKTTARYLSFFLNKGVMRVDLFAAAGEDKELAIVKENLLAYAQRRPIAAYPTDDTSYTSPALAVVGRIVARMSQQVDRNLSNTRSLQVVSISDTHNHYQFAGDGSAAHPNLYDRDVFAFLPYQVNAKRFVIPYYVMTRDVMKDLAMEQFTVQIAGVNGRGASITAYDPILNKDIPVVVNSQESNNLSLKLNTTDYPRLLIIQEAQ